MAWRSDGGRHDRGMAQLNATLLVIAAIALAALVALALLSFLGRTS
jgi:hypothetical protein